MQAHLPRERDAHAARVTSLSTTCSGSVRPNYVNKFDATRLFDVHDGFGEVFRRGLHDACTMPVRGFGKWHATRVEYPRKYFLGGTKMWSARRSAFRCIVYRNLRVLSQPFVGDVVN